MGGKKHTKRGKEIYQWGEENIPLKKVTVIRGKRVEVLSPIKV